MKHVQIRTLRSLIRDMVSETKKKDSKKWTAFYYTESGGIGGYGQNQILGFVYAATKEDASKRAEKLFGVLYSGNYGWVEETTSDHEEEFQLRNPTGYE